MKGELIFTQKATVSCMLWDAEADGYVYRVVQGDANVGHYTVARRAPGQSEFTVKVYCSTLRAALSACQAYAEQDNVNL